MEKSVFIVLPDKDRTFPKFPLGLFLAVLLWYGFSFAQNVPDAQAPRALVKVFSENDYWFSSNSTDAYYTQGLKIQYLQVLDSTSRFAGYCFFFKEEGVQNAVGYSIGQNIYTSTDISKPEIMVGDRPYGAWLYLGATAISNSTAKRKRITSDLYLGVIGPIAQGEFIQRNFHKLIHSPKPEGWPNQIANDIGVNLGLQYEKGFDCLSFASQNNTLFHLDLVPHGEVLVGSVFNTVGIGAAAKLSLFNSSPYFADVFGVGGMIKKKGIQEKRLSFFKSFAKSNLAIFSRSTGKTVIWNSLLQGGFFNRSSPYTIRSAAIRRLYLDVDYGITYSHPYFDLSYSRAFRTKEFEGQERHHQWGQLYLTVKI